MLRKHVVQLLTLLLLSAAVPAWGQPKPKDREEFDLFNTVLKETDAKKKLQLLDSWKQKYPQTELEEQRQKFYMQAHQQDGQPAKAVEAAKEVLKLVANDFSANFMIASLVPFMGSADAKVLADGEAAAHGLQKAEKPPNVTDADWSKARAEAQFIAHQVLGWVAMQQKKNDAAEQEFLKALELKPATALISYWLGTVVQAQRNPEKSTLALFSFARAASYSGPGALAPAGRQQMESFLSKAYASFHGPDPAGFDELKKLAAASPLPPAGFRIKSKDEIKVEQEEELRKKDPVLAFFITVKQRLNEEGDTFWQSMKGTAMPKLKGTVLTATPPLKPKTLTLAMTQSTEAEVTLTLETPLPRKLDAGTAIEFEGAEPTEFTKEPFMVKMQGGKITAGLPEPPKPAPKAPGKAGAKTKKAAKK